MAAISHQNEDKPMMKRHCCCATLSAAQSVSLLFRKLSLVTHGHAINSEQRAKTSREANARLAQRLVANLQAAMAIYQAPETFGVVVNPCFNQPSPCASENLSVILAAIAIDQNL